MTLTEYLREYLDRHYWRKNFIPVAIDEAGQWHEGELGGPHPRDVVFVKNGFRDPKAGSPFIEERIFYRLTSRENVERLTELIESGVSPDQLISVWMRR